MCLVTAAVGMNEEYPFVFIGNRDEEYERPASSIHFWPDYPSLLAGQDLKGGGTWLGITHDGKMATLLNHPFTGLSPKGEKVTRGRLVLDYLIDDMSTEEYGNHLVETRKSYEPYHFVFGSIDQLYLYSNGTDDFQKLAPNQIISISNTPDDLSNFRMNKAKIEVEDYVTSTENIDIDRLIEIFQDTQKNPDVQKFPKEITKEEAEINSSIFIEGNEFGTVSTTAILVDKNGQVHEKEVKYNPNEITKTTEKRFTIEK